MTCQRSGRFVIHPEDQRNRQRLGVDERISIGRHPQHCRIKGQRGMPVKDRLFEHRRGERRRLPGQQPVHGGYAVADIRPRAHRCAVGDTGLDQRIGRPLPAINRPGETFDRSGQQPHLPFPDFKLAFEIVRIGKHKCTFSAFHHGPFSGNRRKHRHRPVLGNGNL
jgi:hypothetical protein